MKIKIDKNKEYQKYTDIGASGAWGAQCVGGWSHALPDGTQVREKIAELL